MNVCHSENLRAMLERRRDEARQRTLREADEANEFWRRRRMSPRKQVDLELVEMGVFLVALLVGLTVFVALCRAMWW